MTKTLQDIDAAARANLTPAQLAEYFRYKRQLSEDGEGAESQRQILTGFIWDASEEAEEE